MLALLLSPRGCLAPQPFARGVIAVYLAAFLSQLLAAPPAIAHAGLAPFALAQALVTWCWLSLHAKRLRDAGEGTGAAFAIAGLYALAVVLFLLMLALIADPLPRDATSAPGASLRLADFFVWFLLIAMLAGGPDLGLFGYVVVVVLMLVVITILVAIVFSIMTWRRPSAAPAPAAS